MPDSTFDRRTFLRGALGLGAAVVLGPRIANASHPQDGEWIAADLHAHTIYSTDVGFGRKHRDAAEAATARGWTPAEQIAIARARGLHVLALTDHNTVAHLKDAGYRASDIVLVPGYEHSLVKGHAGLLGVRRRFDTQATTERSLARLIRDVHDEGGIVIAHHPRKRRLPWAYPMTVRPDAVEIWNSKITAQENEDGLRWWARGLTATGAMPATAASDNHYRNTTALAGVGQPTTWVYVRARTVPAVLEAVRAGRTTMSAAPPALSGTRVLLTARSGSTTWMIGDTVHTKGPITVRAEIEGPAMGATLRITVDGRRHADLPVTREYEFRARPSHHVRAEVHGPTGLAALSGPIYFAGL